MVDKPRPLRLRRHLMVTICLDPQTYHARMSVAEEVRHAASLGYEHVELSPRADFFFWHRYPKADDAAIEEVRGAMKETGTRIHTLVPVFNWASPDELERTAQVRNWRRHVRHESYGAIQGGTGAARLRVRRVRPARPGEWGDRGEQICRRGQVSAHVLVRWGGAAESRERGRELLPAPCAVDQPCRRGAGTVERGGVGVHGDPEHGQVAERRDRTIRGCGKLPRALTHPHRAARRRGRRRGRMSLIGLRSAHRGPRRPANASRWRCSGWARGAGEVPSRTGRGGRSSAGVKQPCVRLRTPRSWRRRGWRFSLESARRGRWQPRRCCR
ncbi:TIM barrel protein [Cellulomonas sp. NPDC055163]